jgi:hypothetical protein
VLADAERTWSDVLENYFERNRAIA